MSKARRLRDIGLEIGGHPTGPTNTIVDVPGVRVGHCSIRGQGGGDKPINTGVTVVVPGQGNPFVRPLPAAVDVFNGHGKSAGIMQIQERGQLETPVYLTSTLSVGRAWDAAMSVALEQNPRAVSINPAVFECNDASLNDARGRHVREAHVREALAAASCDGPELGSVGAGSGMRCLGRKGGVGSASRLVRTQAAGDVKVGVLSLNNFGGGRLQWRGRPIPPPPQSHQGPTAGSVIIVIATDAAIAPNVLRRIARRAWGASPASGRASGTPAATSPWPSPCPAPTERARNRCVGRCRARTPAPCFRPSPTRSRRACGTVSCRPATSSARTAGGSSD